MDIMRNESGKIELRVPSILGYEKIAMACVASVAKSMGFDQARIEDLKSAVAEACINAIVHGNKMDSASKVDVVVMIGSSGLEVYVTDNGQGFGDIFMPEIEEQVEGKNRDRGWGIFIMKNLVDELKFEKKPNDGNVVKMVFHLPQKTLLMNEV
jgi:serine/threonine-protein kinase RsbW